MSPEMAENALRLAVNIPVDETFKIPLYNRDFLPAFDIHQKPNTCKALASPADMVPVKNNTVRTFHFVPLKQTAQKTVASVDITYNGGTVFFSEGFFGYLYHGYKAVPVQQKSCRTGPFS